MGPKLTQKQMKRKIKKEQEEAALAGRLAANEKSKAVEQDKKEKQQQQLRDLQQCFLTAPESEKPKTEAALSTLPVALLTEEHLQQPSVETSSVSEPLKSTHLSITSLSANILSNLTATQHAAAPHTASPISKPAAQQQTLPTPTPFQAIPTIAMPYPITALPRASLRWLQPNTIPLNLLPFRPIRGRAPYRTEQFPVQQFLAIPLSAAPYAGIYNPATQYAAEQYLSAQCAALQYSTTQYSGSQHLRPQQMSQYQAATNSSNPTIEYEEIPFSSAPFLHPTPSLGTSVSPEYQLHDPPLGKTTSPSEPVSNSHRLSLSVDEIKDIRFRAVPHKFSQRAKTLRVKSALDRPLDEPSTMNQFPALPTKDIPLGKTVTSTSPMNRSTLLESQESPTGFMKKLPFKIPKLRINEASLNVLKVPENLFENVPLKELSLGSKSHEAEMLLAGPSSPILGVEQLSAASVVEPKSAHVPTKPTVSQFPMPSSAELAAKSRYRVVHKNAEDTRNPKSLIPKEIYEKWNLHEAPSIINYCEFPKPNPRRTENTSTGLYYNSEEEESELITDLKQLHDDVDSAGAARATNSSKTVSLFPPVPFDDKQKYQLKMMSSAYEDHKKCKSYRK